MRVSITRETRALAVWGGHSCPPSLELVLILENLIAVWSEGDHEGWSRKGQNQKRRTRVSDPHTGGCYLRDGSGSKASAFILPFCFSRISTLPSASSSSLRQAAESCIPSSNSVRDFSKGTSPFSSSCTIFSRRWRHSSNLGKESTPGFVSMAYFSLRLLLAGRSPTPPAHPQPM